MNPPILNSLTRDMNRIVIGLNQVDFPYSQQLLAVRVNEIALGTQVIVRKTYIIDPQPPLASVVPYANDYTLTGC